MGRPVCTPWPNSRRLIVTVTVPSRSIFTKANGCWVGLSVLAEICSSLFACASATAGNTPNAKPEAVVNLRNSRRSSFAPAPMVSAANARRPLGRSARRGLGIGMGCTPSFRVIGFWLHRGWLHGCVHKSRSGRCCLPWPHRYPHRSVGDYF